MNRGRYRLKQQAHKPKLARFRKVIGAVSTALWAGNLIQRAIQGPPGRYSYTPALLTQIYANACVWIDQRYAWHKLPLPFGLVVIIGERIKLRVANLQDTSAFPTLLQPEPQARGIEYLHSRMAEGTFNDLRDPRMGSVNTRFGRNVPNEFTWPDPEPRLMSPNPRVVRREL